MNPILIWQNEVRALLPGCLLKRDQRRRALFITDYPARFPDKTADKRAALASAGFTVTADKKLWLLDLSEIRQKAFVKGAPVPVLPERQCNADIRILSLCRSLLSQGIPESQPWEMIRLALLLCAEGDRDELYRILSREIAMLKREKKPLFTAAVPYIVELIS